MKRRSFLTFLGLAPFSVSVPVAGATAKQAARPFIPPIPVNLSPAGITYVDLSGEEELSDLTPVRGPDGLYLQSRVKG